MRGVRGSWWKRRKTARSGARVLLRETKDGGYVRGTREEREESREGEKLRFTGRKTVTKKEWSLRERKKLAKR